MVSARVKGWLRQGVALVALLYPIVLFLTVLALRYVGESWSATGLLLYLPRIGFALPLPFIVVGLLVLRLRRLLALQLVSCLLLVFPLMGFVLPGGNAPDEGVPTLRVMSYNVDSAFIGERGIVEEVQRFSPDVVLFQEIGGSEREFVRQLTPLYPTLHASGQFILASRYPLISRLDPERIPFQGTTRSPRFTQQVLDTPLGKIAFYNMHPISPREGFVAIREAGIKRQVLAGGLFFGLNAGKLKANNALRDRQVQVIAEMASREPYPVVIAGDTNLPTLSAIFARNLEYKDGFSEIGWGLGYTFPANKRLPWMRIDRILTNEPLRFVGFQIGTSRASDHRCVVADLQKQ